MESKNYYYLVKLPIIKPRTLLLLTRVAQFSNFCFVIFLKRNLFIIAVKWFHAEGIWEFYPILF